MTSLPPTVTPNATLPQGSPLKALHEKRMALAAQIEAEMAPTAKITPEVEARVAAMFDEQEHIDARIRLMGLRDERSGGGIVLGTGRPVQEQRDEFAEWATRGYRNGGYELRATTLASLGGTTDVGSNEFIAALERDSTIASVARTVVVNTLAPAVYYRQSAQMSTLAAVAQAADATSRDPAAEKVTLAPVKTAAYTDVSVETLASMPFDVAADLQVQHGEMHAASWEAAFGASGITGPQAIVDTTASVGNAQSIATVTVAGAITPAIALGLTYSSTMKSGYLQGSCFLLSPGTWAATAGQSGAAVYTFGGGNLNSLARDGAGMTFLGYPVYISSGLAAPAANAKVGVFGNVKRGYRIHRYSGVQFSADPFTLAISGQVRYTSLVFQDAAIVDRNAMVTLACAAS